MKNRPAVKRFPFPDRANLKVLSEESVLDIEECPVVWNLRTAKVERMTEKVDVEEFFNNPAEPDVSIELVNLKERAKMLASKIDSFSNNLKEDLNLLEKSVASEDYAEDDEEDGVVASEDAVDDAASEDEDLVVDEEDGDNDDSKDGDVVDDAANNDDDAVVDKEYGDNDEAACKDDDVVVDEDDDAAATSEDKNLAAETDYATDDDDVNVDDVDDVDEEDVDDVTVVDPNSDVDVETVEDPGDQLDHLILQNVRPSLVLELSSSVATPSIDGSVVERETCVAVEKDLSEEDEESCYQKSKNEYYHKIKRHYSHHKLFWNMPFRQRLYEELFNSDNQSLSDDEGEEEVEIGNNFEETVKSEVEQEEFDMTLLDPIIFAPTGDIYSFFQRRKYEPEKFRFPLANSTLVTM